MAICGKWLSLVIACVASVTVSATDVTAADAPPSCTGDLPKTNVHGGIVNVTAKKSWQPRGGEFTFVIETSAAIPADALITVCFGWRRSGEPTNPKEFMEGHPTRIVKIEPDKKVITIAVTVPDLPAAPGRFRLGGEKTKGDRGGALGVYQGFFTVPSADARILIYQPGGTIVVDLLTNVGVTRVGWAAFGALATVAIALALLCWCSSIRQPHLAVANRFLRIIATERNYASLSQAQIILWTLVVGASAVYVMGLSGDLIEISGGTLVLLGISGAAAITSKWKGAVDVQKGSAAAPAGGPAPGSAAPPPGPAPAAPAPAPPPPVASASPGPVAPAPVPPALPPLPPKALPQWSDLVISVERVNGNVVETIDVTRVQMLFFTLITAAFVVMKVIIGYEIPPIPDGFMTLMGISNGVYLGSKFAK